MAKKRSGQRSIPPHLKRRITAARQRIAESGADALLVSHARDIRYLTGFVGDDSWSLVRGHSNQVHILSDSRFDEQIKREAPHAKAVMRRRGLAEELKQLLERLKVDKVQVQPSHVTLAQRKALVKQLGAGRLVEKDDGLLSQRAIKDNVELKAIRKALRIQQRAFEETLEVIEPGWREREVAAYLEYRMRVHGAEGTSFATIAAADANAALPHAIPGQTKLRRNGMLLIDWGARADGYCGDMTRVVALGRMKPKMREVYEVVLEAQLAGIDAIKPGKSVVEVDAAAREVIRKAGYGKYFGHGLGHGIGAAVHEQPALSPRGQGELRPGHVVTVEPGIYLPGVGGVRIEDDVLVGERGARNLSRLPKTLESAMI